jgi:hypothetical protein
MTTEYNFSVNRGDRWDGASFAFVNSGGQAVDLAGEGATAVWTFARDGSPRRHAFSFTTPVDMAFTTSVLTVQESVFNESGVYVHELKVYRADVAPVTALDGTLYVTQGVPV